MAALESLLGPEPMASPLNQYEVERQARIDANRKRMEELGVMETARNLMATIDAAKPRPPPRAPQARKPRGIRPRPDNVRRSGRLTGTTPEYGEVKGDWDEAVTYSDYEGGLDDLLAGDDSDVSSWAPKKVAQFEELRCTSAGRGSMYDSHIGITCHFCRQKKLCGEEGCPRCSRRSAAEDCVGKTDCSKCHGPTGRFCRACLLLRYGQTLEDARAAMAKGEWLCPHCHEKEHPQDGWMCNSSICMKRRGFKPTGIAIYDAQQRGYKSVAHWLQAQLKKRGAAALKEDGGDGAGAAGGGGGASGSRSEATAASEAAGGRGARLAARRAAADAEATAPNAPRRRGRDQDGGAGAASKRARGAAAPAAAATAAASPDAPGRRGRGRGAAGSREGSNEPAPAAPAPAPARKTRAAAAAAGAAEPRAPQQCWGLLHCELPPFSRQLNPL
ncbi:hypothetical protein Rsub_04817 [Raphidocelis subcapitata]|uniref:Zinc-finger domain-containing protein n=1 Tax=Raphidocelis subcapitata TaxID=307507 RepID=A0A2V0NU05_9CHLO|nr:hypothetical protein Rsub_04817 [Raphidocelis subcapitata]|eukprot:GBF91148.1 hypothetical protein Rsub_04817 [Raphidocelis subcapitata]